MYARLVRITVGAADRPVMERLADASAPRYRTLKGFKGVTFLADEGTGAVRQPEPLESRETPRPQGSRWVRPCSKRWRASPGPPRRPGGTNRRARAAPLW